ncbi:MAG: hypothetical protein Q9186_005251 [Xanthomendoza sp. 1 TL-2023]
MEDNSDRYGSKNGLVPRTSAIESDVALEPRPNPIDTLKPVPTLSITGLGSQYPPFTIKSQQWEAFLRKVYDVESPGIKRLLQLNRNTIIESHPIIKSIEDPFWSRSIAPSSSELDRLFRRAGVDLAVQACKKALREAKLSPNDITHTVAFTCTNAGSPGFDLLVCQKLSLKPEVHRTLLHGGGCAGGVGAMRTAAAMAQSYSMRGRPARILVFACEIFSINIRANLDEVVEQPELVEPATMHATMQYSDGAAALVLCNELAEGVQDRSVYEVLSWETTTIPDSAGRMELLMDPLGFKGARSEGIPDLIFKPIATLLERLRSSLPVERALAQDSNAMEAKNLDWALNANLDGVQQKFELHEGQLKASFDVYKNHGYTSSPMVLTILDNLRKSGEGREHLVACSTGPGVTVEMVMLKKVVRGDKDE